MGEMGQEVEVSKTPEQIRDESYEALFSSIYPAASEADGSIIYSTAEDPERIEKFKTYIQTEINLLNQKVNPQAKGFHIEDTQAYNKTIFLNMALGALNGRRKDKVAGLAVKDLLSELNLMEWKKYEGLSDQWSQVRNDEAKRGVYNSNNFYMMNRIVVLGKIEDQVIGPRKNDPIKTSGTNPQLYDHPIGQIPTANA